MSDHRAPRETEPGGTAGPAGVRVVHLPAEHRFDAVLDGVVVGLAEYRPLGSPATGDQRWEVVHTETVPAFRGRGVAAALVAGLVEAAREQGVRVVPVCPYVVAWFARNPAAAGVLR